MPFTRKMFLVAGTMLAAFPALAATKAPYAHVLLISVDGMHQVDLQNWIAAHATSTLATLAQGGIQYTNALTTAPSDSFPGMIAQVTGGTPKTTGLYYDDSYDRSLYAPGSNCVGAVGTETAFAENLDKSLSSVTGGGTLGQPLTQIDTTQLPMRKNADGSCIAVYPHNIIRVNTVFEVIKAAGMRTAWTDKHPAYEVLNGPSGAGIDDLYTPEVNSSNILGGSGDNTKSFAAIRAYDDTKVKSVLNEVAGMDSTGSTAVGVPAILGMNFQSVSVGQKLASSKNAVDAGLTGGYLDANAAPGNALSAQFAYVDGAIGRMVSALKAQNLYSSTLIIVSAKHGQAPIDPTLLHKIDDGAYFPQTPGFAFEIADDGLLLWLDPAQQAAQTHAAAKYLRGIPTATGGLAKVIKGGSNAFGFGDPATDPRAPDFVGVTQLGVVYTTNSSKISEHGGYSLQDRNVPLLVSGGLPVKQQGKTMPGTVKTTQIAPTILAALGLDPMQLQAVVAEGTQKLPGVMK